MLTKNKKSYAGLISGELGKLLPEPSLDIKGLSIKKSSIPKILRKKFTKILEDDILKPEKIDLRHIINQYDQLEIDIENSLKEGNPEYLLPKNLEIIESYKAPDTIEAVRGVLIWNALEKDSQIVPPEKIDLLKLNCTNENDPRLLALKETKPEKYKTIMEVVFNHGISNIKIDISRFGFSCIAIPKGTDKIPDYLIPFIDFKSMVNNNLSNGYILLESLGVYTSQVNDTKYKSNIIEL